MVWLLVSKGHFWPFDQISRFWSFRLGVKKGQFGLHGFFMFLTCFFGDFSEFEIWAFFRKIVF